MNADTQIKAATSAVREVIAAAQRFAGAMIEQFSRIAVAFSTVATAIENNLYSFAEAQYLRHHRRCPGGRCATARLAKKRRTKVMAWFVRHMKRLTCGASC